MNQALRCRCGALQGHFERAPSATRAICYCKDCQAYARFLGTPGVVDADGGTEVVASLPRHVRFTAGTDALACLSLSGRGLLRWYASCCNTPIGNTPRNPKVPYVSLIHACFEGGSPAIEATLGARRIAVNTQSARHPVRSTPFATAARVVGLMGAAVSDRLRGMHGPNPFFADTGAPVRPVRVLSPAERDRAYGR